MALTLSQRASSEMRQTAPLYLAGKKVMSPPRLVRSMMNTTPLWSCLTYHWSGQASFLFKAG